MKTNKSILTLLLTFALIVVIAACGTGATPQAPSAAAQTQAPQAAAEEKTFTAAELAAFDGKNGNKAYIAVNGKVYDVTNIPPWKGGTHQGKFQAGKDYTKEIKEVSPHGTSKLKGVPVVGILK